MSAIYLFGLDDLNVEACWGRHGQWVHCRSIVCGVTTAFAAMLSGINVHALFGACACDQLILKRS